MVEKFVINKAQIEDMEDVFNLSNDEIVRENSFNREKIDWQNHKNWFKNKINDESCVFYIIRDVNKKLIAQVRFDKNGVDADISISISPDFRGMGYGAKILKLTSQKVVQENKIKKINAYVKMENKTSKIVFEKAGYALKEENSEKLRYEFNAE